MKPGIPSPAIGKADPDRASEEKDQEIADCMLLAEEALQAGSWEDEDDFLLDAWTPEPQGTTAANTANAAENQVQVKTDPSSPSPLGQRTSARKAVGFFQSTGPDCSHAPGKAPPRSHLSRSSDSVGE